MTTSEAQPILKATRVHMLDVVRGWSMFLIAGGDFLLLAFCYCFPGLPGVKWMQYQLGHVVWEGFTFYDAIFPTFLLISGAAFTYSWERQCAQGVPALRRWVRLSLRTLLLIVLGFLYNGALSASSFGEIRYASVLARIGLGVYLAAIAYVALPTKWRWVFFPAGLLAYAGLFELCGGEAPYVMTNNWAGAIDRAFLPGRVDASGIDGLDPEGLVSTLGAPLTAYLGMLLADGLRSNLRYKALWIALAGGVLLGIGFAASPWVPIIKKLWTSTYVCVAGGWTLLVCAFIYCLTDVWNLRRWFMPITFFGSAALWFYLLPKLFDFRATAWKMLSGITCALTAERAPQMLVCAVGGLVVAWVTVWLLKQGVQQWRLHR